MKLRMILIVLLLVCIVSVPVLALESRDIRNYNESPMAIAWRKNDTIYVAIVNENSARDSYRIEIYDAQRRSALVKREVIIPGKSILVESFTSRDLKNAKSPIQEVTIYSGYYGRTIKVQEHEWFTVDDYLVPANSSITVQVDVSSIRGSSSFGRIVVDDVFEMYNSRNTGRISVKLYSGFSYTSPNIIEYGQPKLILTMRTPYIRDVDLLSFGIAHRPSSARRDEYTLGPVILVYGRNYEVLGLGSNRSNPSDGSSDWVVR